MKRSQVLVTVVVLGFSGAADATPWTQVWYGLQNYDSQSGNTIVPDTVITDTTGQPVTTGIQTIGNITSYASASPGVLKTSIWSASNKDSVANTAVSSMADSRARAAFSDGITINSPNAALFGQTVVVNSSLLLSGGMLTIFNIILNNSPPHDTYARVFLDLGGDGVSLGWGCTGNTYTACDQHGYYGGVLANQSNPPPSVIPVSFTAQLGIKRGIQYSIELQGRSMAGFPAWECNGTTLPCDASASAELTANYANSLLWGGISSVTDANGNPILDFTVSSDSGFNYATAVPEPGTWAMLIAGLGLLGLVAKRRSRKEAIFMLKATYLTDREAP